MSAERYDAGYQGEPGAYSEQAGWNFFGPSAHLLPCRTLPLLFDAVLEGRARSAVLPVENNLAGTVPRAYELLADRRLFAHAETQVHIDHVLIGRAGAKLDAVTRVLSHPVALDQCRGFFGGHPACEPVAAFDTAGAVAMALEDPSGRSAAIASRRAAELHGAAILATDIQDHPENRTRFLLVDRSPEFDASRARRLILWLQLAHRPGALAGVLHVLATSGANVTKIESRPIPAPRFEYSFIIEADLDDTSRVMPTLVRVEAVALGVTLLGAF
jgi:prephenate dehydratase